MRANACRRRPAGLALRIQPILAACVSACSLSIALAHVAEPTWCVGQAPSYADVASAALLLQATQDASRGENDSALGRLCTAYMRRDVQRDPQVAGNVANFAGTILFRGPGNLDAAMAAFRDAISHTDVRRHPSEAATAHVNLGNAFYRRGAYPDARLEVDTSGQIANTIPNADLRNAVLATIAIKRGLLAEATDTVEAAAAQYQDALRLAAMVSDQAEPNVRAAATNTRGEAMHNLAGLQSTTGRYAEAIRSWLELRDWARANRSDVTEYWATYSLMTAYQDLERHREALALAPALDDLQRRSPDAGLRASTQMARARSFYALGQLDAAMPPLKEAASYFADQRMVNELAQALNSMGLLAMSQGRAAQAREAFTRALEGRLVLKDRVGEGLTLNALADLAWREGDADAAVDLLQQAVQVLQATPAPLVYARALGSLGVVLQDQGKKQQARDVLERAVDLLWRYRAVRQSSLLGANENDHVRPIYNALLQDYLADGDDKRALSIAEQVRAAGVRSDASVSPDTALRTAGDRYSKALARARDRVFRAMRSQEEEPGPAAEQAVAVALREIDAAVAQLELALPAEQRKDSGFPVLLSSVQRALGSSRALLLYHKTEDSWLLFAVTDGSIKAIPLEIKPPVLSGLVTSFREFSWDDGAVPPELKALYAVLIKPAIPSVGTRDLIVVPSAELNQVPFVALHDGQDYVAQTRLVTQALGVGHALQLLTAGLPVHDARGVFLSAAAVSTMPALSHADAEARYAADKLPNSRVALDASLQTYFSLAPGASVIHIAAHAVADTAHPLLSRIVLMPAGLGDGLLSVSDIRRAPLNARPLVVLSACESGIGRVRSDESVQALSSAFLQAGADAVIASLWLVDDASTSSLMGDFYEALANRMAPPLALRAAMQRAMKRNPHPFYWAAFTYTGPL
ncbi:CHAT domain-containing protein [Niveibacterium microcysteis]|uniref:CHAT domain-containing protein n=1 Tax=Niveibacterium microcysteis TaxID=2811415 RepID=A0ABX7M0R6_9RHOO|nr:CHAT domain-containing protein [Niveibacterium microcysteis]QSI75351.1 CHAT domain-containing protein [Niveibacterium microcysteis]